jgi:hypothetical protein
MTLVGICLGLRKSIRRTVTADVALRQMGPLQLFLRAGLRSWALVFSPTKWTGFFAIVLLHEVQFRCVAASVVSNSELMRAQ